MTIDKLNSTINNKSITVSFSYEEIRDLSNSTFEAYKNNKNFSSIHGKMLMAFSLTKNGNIPVDFELPKILELLEET